MRRARRHGSRAGRQPRPVEGRPGVRPDRRGRHRRAGSSSASGRSATSASCSRSSVAGPRRGSSVERSLDHSRRWRPCGRRGRSRSRRCPSRSTARMWRTSCTSQANARTSKRWNSVTRPGAPLAVVHVHRLEPGAGEVGGVALHRLGRCRRLVECTRWAAAPLGSPRRNRRLGEHSHRRSAAPPASASSRIGLGRGPVLHVDRELEVGPELGVEVARRGTPKRASRSAEVRATRTRRRPRQNTSSWTSTTSPSDEQPGVGLEAARRPAPGRGGRPPRVFSGSSARAPRWAKVIGGLLIWSHSLRSSLPHAAGGPAAGGPRRLSDAGSFFGPILGRARARSGSQGGLRPCRCTSWQGPEAHMTTIRAQCPSCGDVRLTATTSRSGSAATTTPAPTGSAARRATPRWRRRRAPTSSSCWSPPVCVCEMWRRPAELRERRNGPPLTLDDLLDFHVLLQRDDWVGAAASTDRPSTAG